MLNLAPEKPAAYHPRMGVYKRSISMDVTFESNDRQSIRRRRGGHDAALYEEDPPHMTDATKFPRTIQFLLANPTGGTIILFQRQGALCGYAISLIPFWSNEFGGTLLMVDELFVIPSARSRGIGRAFFDHLHSSRPFDAVAVSLEVSPASKAAGRSTSPRDSSPENPP